MSDASVQRRRRGPGLAAVFLCALIGVCLGLGAFTLDYAETTSYLSNDPKACVNCHIMRDHFEAWQKGPHHAYAACNDCHVPKDTIGKYLTKMEHGYRHSKGFTLQDFHEPIQIKESSLRIVEDNCVRCHSGLVGDIAGHAATTGDRLSCVHCHTSAGHGPQR